MVEPPRLTVKPEPVAPLVSVPTPVNDEPVTPDASVEPVSVPAGAITALLPAAVMRPLALTVKLGMAVEEPNEPVLPLTVASVVASVPLVVRSPERSPLVTAVAPENFARLPEAGEP